MPDYFPLVKGAVREYATENSRGAGTYKVEVLEVSAKDAATTAKCRRTINLPGEPERVAEFTVTKDASGVHEGDDVEFKTPLEAGTEWVSPPRRTWIEALDAEVETPAGKFTDCLKVAYLIAEGDGGSGERHYAPGVGLVKVADNDEGEPLTYQLVKKLG
ncbi:MAG: hypothetical protein PHS14_01165 [Elusimicrobia bacterium]|nr:hypothetical protein [Elusimicrobiota bacterium]